MRGVELSAPVDRLFQVVSGQGVEETEAIVQLLAMLDHRALHGEHPTGILERHRAPVLEHEIWRHQEIDVLDPLERLQAADLRPLLADEIVWSRIEPARRRHVQDVGGAAAVVEEAAHGVAHEVVAGAEDLLVLLERAEPRRLVAGPLRGGAQESGHPGLHALQRNVPIAGGLDVDARRLVEAAHDLPATQNELSPLPPGPLDASLMRLLISEISLIHMWRSLCSIERMSSMPQWKWYAM